MLLGWVTDEQPVGVRAAGSTFQTPLDEVCVCVCPCLSPSCVFPQEDGAARVLDPIFSFVNNPTGSPLHGVFLKDYTHSTW